MPEDTAAIPDGSTAPSASPAEPSPGSDEAVAQGHFDEWSATIENRIGHLEDAIAHVIASRGASHHAGPTAAEQSAAPGTGEGQEPDGEIPGVSSTHSSQEAVEPERPPQSAKLYWRRIGFGRG